MRIVLTIGFLIFLLLVLLLPRPLRAAVPVEFRIIPPGDELTVGGKTQRCYALPQWLELARADSELWEKREESESLRGIIELLQKRDKNLSEIVRTYEDDKKILDARIQTLEFKLGECHKGLEDCGSPSYYGAAAILGGVIGVVGLGFAIGVWVGS